MSKILVSVVAEDRHTGMIKRTLRAAGVQPDAIAYLGGDAKLSIPSSTQFMVLRTVSCSHTASATAQSWRRTGPNRRILRANTESSLRTDLKKANLWHPVLIGKAARAAVLRAIEDGCSTLETIQASHTGFRYTKRDTFWGYISDLKKQGLAHNAAERAMPARYVLGPVPEQKARNAPKTVAEPTPVKVAKPTPPEAPVEVTELTEWVDLLREECSTLRAKLKALTEKQEEMAAAHKKVLVSMASLTETTLAQRAAREQGTPKTSPVKALVLQLREAGFKGALTLEL